MEDIGNYGYTLFRTQPVKRVSMHESTAKCLSGYLEVIYFS